MALSFCAVPGLAVPGAMVPGVPGTVPPPPVPPPSPSGLPQVTVVSVSPVQVFSAAGLTGAAAMLIINQGPPAVYAGASGVAALTGLYLGAGQSMLVSGPAQDLWAVTRTGTATVLADCAASPAVA